MGYTFAENVKPGKWAVSRVIELVENDGYVVSDVQSDKSYQKIDVDLVAIKDNVATFIEVKGDRYPAVNMYIEVVSNKSKDTPGCILYTESDYLYYYYINVGKLLIFPTKELQSWVANKLDKRFKRKTVTTTLKERDLYDSYGYAVPIAILLSEIDNVVVLDDLERINNELTSRN